MQENEVSKAAGNIAIKNYKDFSCIMDWIELRLKEMERQYTLVAPQVYRNQGGCIFAEELLRVLKQGVDERSGGV